MLAAWRAVVVDDHHVAEHFLDRGLAGDSTSAAGEGGIGEQGAEAGAVAVVDESGVGRDEVLDGPVAGGRVGRSGAHPW